MKNDRFAVFILTHGRPNKVVTYRSLVDCGYTGEVFFVVDDEDDTKYEYIKKFGDKVVLFSKKDISERFDTGDNFSDNRTIVYARNACFEIAERLGIKYFVELDDDYPTFAYKFDLNYMYGERKILNLDKVFSALLKFYKKVPCHSVAMAQNGDFIGGGSGGFGKEITLKRKAMNSFICTNDRPFKFVGRINEDVNTYTNLGGRGYMFLTVNLVALHQMTTQKNKGGMSGVYLDSGTYLKSFYSVMYSPSCVKVSLMGDKHKRVHHRVSWNNAVPVIMRENNGR